MIASGMCGYVTITIEKWSQLEEELDVLMSCMSQRITSSAAASAQHRRRGS